MDNNTRSSDSEPQAETQHDIADGPTTDNGRTVTEKVEERTETRQVDDKDTSDR